MPRSGLDRQRGLQQRRQRVLALGLDARNVAATLAVVLTIQSLHHAIAEETMRTPTKVPTEPRAANAIRYDWVFFDYGGTLTLEPKVNRPVPPPHKTGRALQKWFTLIGERVGLSAQGLEEVSAEAHRRTEGEPGQESVEHNRRYYRAWMPSIYQQSGITRSVTLAELDCGRSYLVWQVGLESAAPTGPITRATLERLRAAGIRLGVISNNNGFVRDALLHDGLLEFFEVVIDSAEAGVTKPDPRIFKLATEGLPPGQRLLYVGNVFEIDVRGALAAGWDAVLLGDEPTAPLPDNVHHARSLSDLERICGITNDDALGR